GVRAAAPGGRTSVEAPGRPAGRVTRGVPGGVVGTSGITGRSGGGVRFGTGVASRLGTLGRAGGVIGVGGRGARGAGAGGRAGAEGTPGFGAETPRGGVRGAGAAGRGTGSGAVGGGTRSRKAWGIEPCGTTTVLCFTSGPSTVTDHCRPIFTSETIHDPGAVPRAALTTASAASRSSFEHPAHMIFRGMEGTLCIMSEAAPAFPALSCG